MKKHLAKIAILLVICMCLPIFTACDISGMFGKQQSSDASDDANLNDDNTDVKNNGDFEMVLRADSNSYKLASYNGNEKNLEIPAMHNGMPVVEIGEKAFMGNKTLVSVVIPDSVEIIGDSAFKNCQRLELVTIGKYESKLGEIAKQVFLGCTLLEFIEFVGEGDIWESISKGKDWDKNAGAKTDCKKYELVFIEPTEVPTENLDTDRIDTDQPEEMKFSYPAYGTVIKRHDPNLQVFNPSTNEYRVHLGIDIATNEGAPVYAVANGTVDKIWEDALMGKCISIIHDMGFVSIYKNIDAILEDGIVEGAKVKGGQQIAKVGTTALMEIADEPHLHFEMTLNGIMIDPEDYLDTADGSTNPPETDSDINIDVEIELFAPIEGEISKGHDPNIQYWNESTGDYRVHLGVDILTYEGAAVFASADGTVEKIWDDALMGRCIAIDHGNGICSFYKNLDPASEIAIAEGAKVKGGQQIGNVGESAIIEIAELPHLHFEMTVNGITVDPLDYFKKNDPENCAHLYLQYIESYATCTESGRGYLLCDLCGSINGEYTVSPMGHNLYTVNSEERPMCGLKYYVTHACYTCGETVVEEIVATHEGEVINTVAPTVATYGYTLVKCQHCGGQFRTDIQSKLTDTAYFEPYYRSAQVLEGRYRWLFYLGDKSAAYYNGTNLLTDAELEEYAEVLATLNELCESQGKTLQISVYPNKDQVYPEFTGLEDIGYQNKRTYKWVKYIQDNTNVKIIYPIEELMAMKPYFDVYGKYDTHWNVAGGFIGYQATLESLGLPTTSILDCPAFEYSGGNRLASDHYFAQLKGDMLGMGGWSINNEDYPSHVTHYIKYRSEVDFTFVDGTDNKNGSSDIRHTVAENATFDKNLVMLGDSFRVMQLAYIEKDFSDAYLCHRNHVHESSTVAALNNADIIVIQATERYDSTVIDTARQLINILSSN